MFFSRVYSLGMLVVSILDPGPPSLYLLTGYFRKPSAGLSGLSLFIDREIMEIKALSQPATCLKKIILILST